MGRCHRYTDDHTAGRHIFELTRKVVAGTYLLRPDPDLNALLVGVYAHALLHPRFRDRIRVHELVLQSNHLHMLCSAASQEVIQDFEEYVASILAKRVGRLRGWRGRVWDARYSLTQVFPSKQRFRQRYLHSQGLRENLYRSPSENPCVSSYKAWSTGKLRLTGRWLDAHAMRDAGVRWEDPEHAKFEREVHIQLHPLPIDEGKTKAQLVAQTRAQGKSIIAEHDKRRAKHGVGGVLGAQAIQDASPFDRPRRTKKGKAAPLAFGTRKEVAAFEDRHRKAGEQRRALLAKLVRHAELADYPEQAAMPSVLRAAIRRANEEDLKAAQVLAEAGRVADAAEKIAATPVRRPWPVLGPAPVVPRGAKPKKKPRAVRPKKRKPQPKPTRAQRLRGKRLIPRPFTRRRTRLARRLRRLARRPLPPRVIEIAPTIPALSGEAPRTYVLLWIRCCVGGEDDQTAGRLG